MQSFIFLFSILLSLSYLSVNAEELNCVSNNLTNVVVDSEVISEKQSLTFAANLVVAKLNLDCETLNDPVFSKVIIILTPQSTQPHLVEDKLLYLPWDSSVKDILVSFEVILKYVDVNPDETPEPEKEDDTPVAPLTI